jgi:hypothetical protein
VDKQTVWNIVNSILGLVGSVGAFYAYTQVKLIREERARREKVERELAEWSARAEVVTQKLVALYPRWWPGREGFSQCPPYPMILSQPELRGVVEGYLIRPLPSAGRAEARMLTPDMLRLQVVRETIKRVAECFDSILKKSSLIAAQASL